MANLLVLALLVIVLSVAAGIAPISFSYDPTATNGPKYWATLPFDHNSCDGKRNSPIALPGKKACDLVADYIFETGNCTLSDLTFALHNHAVETYYPKPKVCSSTKVKIPKETGTFDLQHFHIHAGSEHSIHQAFFPAELHLVFRQRNGNRLAIFGIFLTTLDSKTDDHHHPEFDKLLNEWNDKFQERLANCSQTTKTKSRRRLNKPKSDRHEIFNISNLIPADTSFYAYEGSLTTPPCSEIVSWSVASKPLAISSNQLKQLISIILNYRDAATCQIASVASPNKGTTSRPIQPRNGRNITHICPAVLLSDTRSTSSSLLSPQQSTLTSGPSIGRLAIAALAALIGIYLISRSKRRSKGPYEV